MQPVSSAIFLLHHAHVRKDTRPSLLFRTESDGKLGGAFCILIQFELTEVARLLFLQTAQYKAKTYTKIAYYNLYQL